MIRLTRRLAIAAAAALLPAAALAATHEVSITADGFVPREIGAESGDTVIFTNAHDRAHTATADDGTFDTGRIQPGESRSVTIVGPTGYADRFNPRFTGAVGG